LNKDMTLPLLRSLSGRDFRLYFGGQFVSFVGTWVQQVALSWIAYRVTGSAAVLGLVAFASQAPTLLLGPAGGILADRVSRRGILVFTQVVEMGVALALAILAAQGLLNSHTLVAAALVLGVAIAFEMPARQALIADLVHEHGHLSNAIALNSVSFNVARLVGPALGALMLAGMGDLACFLANAASYIVEICTLLMLRPRHAREKQARGTLAQGLAYLRTSSAPRWLLLTVAFSSVALAPFVTLLPVFAKEVFNRDVDSLGMMMAAFGFGSLAAALTLANRAHVSGFSLKVVAGCLCAGAAAAVLSCNQHFLVALALMVVSGWSTVMIVTSSHILLQAVIPDHMRGQLMAFFGMAYGGALSVASLCAGALASMIGARPVFLASAVLYVAVGLALNRVQPRLRQAARPILIEKGLVPK
jgi:MFS family permease